MGSPAIKDSLSLYAEIMVEFKHRIDAINQIRLTKDVTPRFRNEFGYLQLRFICELVSLACLVAHGDLIAANRKGLLNEQNLDAIMKKLSALHDDFFPVAIKWSQAGYIANADEISPRVMAWNDVTKIYADCGNQLHRGRLKHLARDKGGSFDKISGAAQKFIDLLGCHAVFMKAAGDTYFCHVYSSRDGDVHLLRGKRSPP